MRLAADPALRGLLGENGRRYAETHFDVETKAIQFEEIFAAAMRSAAQRSRGGTSAHTLPAGLSPPRGAALLRRTE